MVKTFCSEMKVKLSQPFINPRPFSEIPWAKSQIQNNKMCKYSYTSRQPSRAFEVINALSSLPNRVKFCGDIR